MVDESPEIFAGEMLYGAAAIAKFLGITRRQAFHLISSSRIPTFKIGANVCARRATLSAWLDEQEAGGKKAPSA